MDEKNPALFKHLYLLYTYLMEEAVSDGVDYTWTGSQRKTFDRMNLSNAMNPILFRGLREMGCVEMVQRGAGDRPTILKLVRNPQIEQFREWNQSVMSERALTPRVALGTIEQELRLLARRLPKGVDLPQWILNIEDRLIKIENRLDGIEKERASGTKAKRSSTRS